MDFLQGIYFYVQNTIRNPVYFEYSNDSNNCFFIFNVSNINEISAVNYSFAFVSNIVFVSRFSSMKLSLDYIWQLFDTFKDFCDVLEDDDREQAIIQWVNVVNGPRFSAVNRDTDSVEYNCELEFHYLTRSV